MTTKTESIQPPGQESEPASPGAEAGPGPTERVGADALLRDLKTLPNLVSIARIVLVYGAIWLWFEGRFGIGLIVGILAGLSDYLDGYLARRLRQSTRIGGLLDQAADILFMTGCILIFVKDGTWPAILLLIVLLRETVVLNLRASAASMGFEIPSIFLGKWSSNWMFYALAIMGAHRGALLGEPYNTYAGWLAHFGMVVGVTSSVITGLVYVRTYAQKYRA
jgi:cardiolipin synthase